MNFFSSPSHLSTGKHLVLSFVVWSVLPHPRLTPHGPLPHPPTDMKSVVCGANPPGSLIFSHGCSIRSVIVNLHRSSPAGHGQTTAFAWPPHSQSSADPASRWAINAGCYRVSVCLCSRVIISAMGASFYQECPIHQCWLLMLSI